MSGSIGSSVQAASGVGTLVSLLMTAALSQLWGMINGMQLVVHIPMISEITDSIPPKLSWLINQLITIASFSFLDT